MKDLPKKTIQVHKVKEHANKILLHSPDDAVANRVGVCMLLEHILHETNNYNGFAYLTPHDMEKSLDGTIPGIRHFDYPKKVGDRDTRWDNVCQYRRLYF